MAGGSSGGVDDDHDTSPGETTPANGDAPAPADAAAAPPMIPLATPAARPAVLTYRNPRDEAARRRRLRERRRERRRRRRPSKAGVVGLIAAALLAIWSLAALASAAASDHARRPGGPASLVCTTLPLTYVAVMCGVVGVIPRGKSTVHGWCALAVTAVSWIAYVAAYVVASS